MFTLTMQRTASPAIPFLPTVFTISRNTASLPLSASKTLESTDRKSTRLNSSHGYISYAVFCLKKKNRHSIPVTRVRPLRAKNGPHVAIADLLGPTDSMPTAAPHELLRILSATSQVGGPAPIAA